MGEVFLDGEKVDFQGAAPRSVGAAWEVVGNHLAAQERVVDTTTVDGAPWQPDADPDREEWRRLEFRSVGLEAKLVQLVKGWENRREETRARVERLAGIVLVQGWEEAQGQVFEVFETLRPLIEQFGTLLSLGEARGKQWAQSLMDRYGACGQALEATSKAVESEDCVVLSDLLSDSLAPALDAMVVDAARALDADESGESQS